MNTLEIGQIHRKEYDQSEPLVIAEAPGRVHLLGDHGEPRAGLFLSTAINRYIRIAVSVRKDASFRFYAVAFDEHKRATLTNLKYKREDRWSNYIKVAIQLFVRMGFIDRGLNFTIDGDIPQQIGLASSTAIEMSTAVALKKLFHANISNRDMVVRLARMREIFLGKGISLVDYEIIMNAKKGRFMIFDERDRDIQYVQTNLDEYKVLILDSRVPRIDIEQELRQRRHDIRKGLEILSKHRPGLSFRNFTPADFIEVDGDLSETIRRRSFFVVQELKRVPEVEEAIKKHDIQSLSRALFHSHEGLRDLLEVSCPEIDWLVKRSQETEGVAGSRMTGLGFGGCTYVFIKADAITNYQKRLEDYERIFGFRPIIYEMDTADGARVVEEER
ncbi:MAG: galactokinase [Treponema sp.]|nr:galactokinase [Treponema sp.]